MEYNENLGLLFSFECLIDRKKILMPKKSSIAVIYSILQTFVNVLDVCWILSQFRSPWNRSIYSANLVCCPCNFKKSWNIVD